MAHIVFVESNSLGLQAFAAAKEAGHSVTFLYSRANGHLYDWDGQTDADGKPAKAEFRAVDRCLCIGNTMATAEVEQALQALTAEHPVDAVISVLEYSMVAATRAAANLQLRATSAEAVEISRDKCRMRRTLAAAGVEDVRCKQLDAETASTWEHYPAVVKPRAGAASDFVRVVRSRYELGEATAAYEAGLAAIDPALAREIGSGLLIEEYLSGPMLSVEVLVGKGEARVLTTGQRERCRLNEVVELGSVMPAALPEVQRLEVEQHVLKAVHALGFDRGILHIEVVATAAGPRLIEINPRLMGGPLPALYRRVYGCDVFSLLVKAHLDQELPAELPAAHRVGIARVFGSLNGGRLKASFNLDWTPSFAPAELELSVHARPGGQAPCLNSNHDYLGLFSVLAATAAAAAAAADAVLDCLTDSLGVELARS